MFARGLYSEEAVKLAAYVCADKAEIKLSAGKDGLTAELRGCGRGEAGEFLNEALNQQCRLDLAAANGRLANMIVTKALLSASGETGGKRGKK